MPGALMQLTATGTADIYLHANPQITFFKLVYRRHLHFGIETREFPFSDTPGFGRRSVCRLVADDVDLLSHTSLQVTLPAIPANSSWIPFVGEFLIKQAIFEVGGAAIDRQYGEWLHIWNELTCPAGKARNYLRCVNGYGGVRVPETPYERLSEQTDRVIADLASRGTDAALGCRLTVDNSRPVPSESEVEIEIPIPEIPEHTLTIPLPFFYTLHPGLSLPLKQLGRTPVNILVEFADRQHLVNQPRASPPIRDIVSASIVAECVLLEREQAKFVNNAGPTDYIIQQVQIQEIKGLTQTKEAKLALEFNGPVKEIAWVVQSQAFRDPMASSPWRFSDAEGNNPVSEAKILMNGHDRFSWRTGSYFNHVQPYYHHTGSPSSGINVYNFGLQPEDYSQPSGACPFDRVDITHLDLRLTDATFRVRGQDYDGNPRILDNVPVNVTVYALNLNKFRVAEGCGGVVSNYLDARS